VFGNLRRLGSCRTAFTKPGIGSVRDACDSCFGPRSIQEEVIDFCDISL